MTLLSLRIKGDLRKCSCNNGYGTFTWTDGAKYVGEFKEGSMHGRGTYITTDGSTYAGEFKDGKLVELTKQPKKKLMKMRMEIAPTGFDFVCYNSCKERNDDGFCRKQCSLQ